LTRGAICRFLAWAARPTPGNFTLSGNAQNRPTGLAYDAAGNLMSYLSSTYTYDEENRLSSTAGTAMENGS
jgi:hypothetical protein